jgi:hypothetical protein
LDTTAAVVVSAALATAVVVLETVVELAGFEERELSSELSVPACAFEAEAASITAVVATTSGIDGRVVRWDFRSGMDPRVTQTGLDAMRQFLAFRSVRPATQGS